jgi:hypothetical protein
MKILFLFFFTGVSFGQQLHRQMLSANGQVATTPKGVKVSQTIGQQSTTGTAVYGKMIVSQGFQQSKSAAAAVKALPENKTIVYPNPFTDQVNFRMTKPVEGKILFSLFDVQGRLLIYLEKEAIEHLLTIPNLNLPAGKYFVKLEGSNYLYFTAILKYK